MIPIIYRGDDELKNLRRNFERFCYKNRDKGIQNLMLYITIGSAVVYLMSLFDDSNVLYYALCFNRELILQGQVWRLFTYVFTYNAGSFLIMFISMICYFSLGRAIERLWGTFRFNLFYFTGVILMDLFCMLFGGFAADPYYLNMSLFLSYATLYPDAGFLLFYLIPVKAWIFALLDLVLTFWEVFRLTAAGLIPYNLFPLIAIANYFLFFGKDVLNVIPLSWRSKLRRNGKKPAAVKTGPIPFTPPVKSAPKEEAYTHKCTVCGRTDVSHPDLEFRYCSRCNGYHCYCEDHISNHTHIE